MSDTIVRFPFSAIVGQERLKWAYLANLVRPGIGGLLISGPKGTGKTTIVFSVAEALPENDVVEGCLVGCDPAEPSEHCPHCRQRAKDAALPVARRPMRVINLPLSCTEDRLIGSIDVEKLLGQGTREVEPGLLGEAHRNILYVDEVNLLPDHLVDDILDVAARHWNTIEREGVSFSHRSEFVLIGTMNPEEGDLRPQILDRFPLCARVETVSDPRLLEEIVRRNLLFEKDPGELARLFAPEQARLRETIARARAEVGNIVAPPALLRATATACSSLKVDGQRPDIVIIKTAGALAALNGAAEVGPAHLLMAAELALNHRTRDGGLLDPPSREDIHEAFRKGMAAAPADLEPHRAVRKELGALGELAEPEPDPVQASGSRAREGETARKKA